MAEPNLELLQAMVQRVSDRIAKIDRISGRIDKVEQRLDIAG